jgi:hypothetical protein
VRARAMSSTEYPENAGLCVNIGTPFGGSLSSRIPCEGEG